MCCGRLLLCRCSYIWITIRVEHVRTHPRDQRWVQRCETLRFFVGLALWYQSVYSTVSYEIGLSLFGMHISRILCQPAVQCWSFEQRHKCKRAHSTSTAPMQNLPFLPNFLPNFHPSFHHRQRTILVMNDPTDLSTLPPSLSAYL